MTQIKHILTVARWLSLDVVLGGVIFTEALAEVHKIRLTWSIPVALGCTIWLIYTMDHLIDGNRPDQIPSMDRHKYHRQNRKWIFVFFILVACIGLRVLFYLPYFTLIYGCVLLGLVGLYFLSIWMFKVYFAKELFIAVLYACGVYLGVFSSQSKLELFTFLIFQQTILIAFINLILFSMYEVDQDINDGHHSWVTHFGITKTKGHLNFTLVLLVVLIIVNGFYLNTWHQLIFQIILLFMSAVLTTLYMRPEWFRRRERFRWVGDMIFILPIIILWL